MNAILTPGDGEYVADLGGTKLNVFTYRPPGRVRAVLAVFHGMHRDAGPYRDRAKPLADRIGAVVVSPEFDKERFPDDLYQRGGVAREGKFVPPGKRTIDLVPPLLAWARAASAQEGAATALIAHSAGGQFLSRVAAFVPTSAARLVIVLGPVLWSDLMPWRKPRAEWDEMEPRAMGRRYGRSRQVDQLKPSACL